MISKKGSIGRDRPCDHDDQAIFYVICYGYCNHISYGLQVLHLSKFYATTYELWVLFLTILYGYTIKKGAPQYFNP